jgi:hypothetical protein
MKCANSCDPLPCLNEFVRERANDHRLLGFVLSQVATLGRLENFDDKE